MCGQSTYVIVFPGHFSNPELYLQDPKDIFPLMRRTCHRVDLASDRQPIHGFQAEPQRIGGRA